MRKFIGITLIAAMLISLSSCHMESGDNSQQTTTVQHAEINYSENILFSVNSGAAGYGTLEECTDATIMIYTDKTIRVFMDTEDNPEIASFELLDEDYKKLAELAKPDEISSLQVENDKDACDGSSYYISLYDEKDEMVISKGGYMPMGEEFWETYSAIKDILEPYDIEEIVDAYRDTM